MAKSETRLRDRSGRVFLDAAGLKGRKGFERFKVNPDADFEEVADASAKTAKKKASKKAAAKSLPPKEEDAGAESAGPSADDALSGWE